MTEYDEGRNAPLHLLAKESSFKNFIVRLLDKFKGEKSNLLSVQNLSGHFPLQIAMSSNNEIGAIELLDSKCLIFKDIKGNVEMNALEDLVMRNGIYPKLFKRLIQQFPWLMEKTSESWGTILHLAIDKAPTCAEMLLSNEILQTLNILTKSFQSQTPLMLAIQKKESNIASIILHMDNSTNLVKQNSNGKTVLHLALENDVEIARKIIEKLEVTEYQKEILNLQDMDGNTALMIAIKLEKCQLAESLISKDCIDYDLKNKEGNNILHMTSKHANFALSKTILEKSCHDQQCLAVELNASNILPIQICDRCQVEDQVSVLLNHNEKCGVSQLTKLFEMMDNNEAGKGFKGSLIFKSIKNCWSAEDKSLLWFVTYFEKEDLLSHLISGMKSQIRKR